MNDTLNHATRRLLQVALDMLRNPEADLPPPDPRYPPPKWRTDVTSVEAAWRAVHEAQQLLAEELTRGELEAAVDQAPNSAAAQGGAS